MQGAFLVGEGVAGDVMTSGHSAVNLPYYRVVIFWWGEVILGPGA